MRRRLDAFDPPREIAEFREIFNLVDLDHGGSIDAEELGSLMDLLGMNATEDEIEAMPVKVSRNT